MEWKDDFIRNGRPKQYDFMCELCRKLNVDQTPKTYFNFSEWYATCHGDYVENFLNGNRKGLLFDRT